MTSKEAKDYLISLIERDTPKKVEVGASKYFMFPVCPNCKVELNEYYKNKYCKECGQRLDWNDKGLRS